MLGIKLLFIATAMASIYYFVRSRSSRHFDIDMTLSVFFATVTAYLYYVLNWVLHAHSVPLWLHVVHGVAIGGFALIVLVRKYWISKAQFPQINGVLRAGAMGVCAPVIAISGLLMLIRM